MRVRLIGRREAALILGVTILAPQFAVGAADFYQGKTLQIIVSSGVGTDTYDTLSRLVSRHIGRYLPGNPAVIVVNMPGAGGILAANQLYNIAPRDGTVIGMLDQSIYETQLFKVPTLKADVTKMNWIGRIMTNDAVLVAWHTAAVQKIDDAFAHELVVCSTGSSSQLRWTMLDRLLGLKLKLITGYKGSSECLLAMQRGEVEASSMPWTAFRVVKADWLRDKTVNVLLQTGLDKARDLPDVPRLVDLAQNDEQRRILELFSQSGNVGRSLTAPPGLPPQRVAELREAFSAMLKDPDFLADAAQMKVDLTPLPGDQLQAIIDKSFDYPPAIIAKAQALIQP
jgi:tripartite-type tricarboxylate transporter receptor subunit TctC